MYGARFLCIFPQVFKILCYFRLIPIFGDKYLVITYLASQNGTKQYYLLFNITVKEDCRGAKKEEHADLEFQNSLLVIGSFTIMQQVAFIRRTTPLLMMKPLVQQESTQQDSLSILHLGQKHPNKIFEFPTEICFQLSNSSI